MFGHHDYNQGENYEVVEIDRSDSTLKARNAQGSVLNWICWRDCEAYNEIGWEWLKGQLSVEALEILSAFDGLNFLKLREEIRIALIQNVPNLKEQVLHACLALESQKNED